MGRREQAALRDNGTEGASALSAGPRGGASDLSVLRTTIRRLAFIGLKAYDIWASGASAEDLEEADDTVKPMLEQLLRDGGYAASKPDVTP